MSFFKKTLYKLIKNNVSISTVESCTGGLLAYSFIKNKDASKIFKSGYICYSNVSKSNILKINNDILKRNGAVSKITAKLMVEKLHRIEKTILSISTTGIAGPKGGTKNKPVGLVYIGIKYKSNVTIYKKIFKGSRINIQKMTVKFIHNKLNKLL